MGKNKTFYKTLPKIQDQITAFRTRSAGILKKAAEIAKICDVKLWLVFTDKLGNLFELKTSELTDFNEFTDASQYDNIYKFTLQDYPFQIKDKIMKSAQTKNNTKKNLHEEKNDQSKEKKIKISIDSNKNEIIKKILAQENKKFQESVEPQLPVVGLSKLLEQKLLKKKTIEQEYEILQSLLQNKNDSNDQEIEKEEEKGQNAVQSFMEESANNPSVIQEFLEFQKMYLENKKQDKNEGSLNNEEQLKQNFSIVQQLQNSNPTMALSYLNQYPNFSLSSQAGQAGQQFALKSPSIQPNYYLPQFK